MAIAFVQASAWYSSSSLVLGHAFYSNVTAGNLLLVTVYTSSSSATSALSDTQGNTYTQVGSYQSLSGGGKISLWRTFAATTGTCQVYVTMSVASQFAMLKNEYSGVSAFNSTTGTTGTSAAPSPGSVTASSGDMIVASYGTVDGFLGSLPSGYTNGDAWSASLFNCRMAYKIGVSGSESPTFGIGGASAAWVSLGASFTPTSPPPPPPAAGPFIVREMPISDLYAPWFTLQAPFPGPVGFQPQPPQQSPPPPPGHGPPPPVPPPPPPGVPPPPLPPPPIPPVPPGSPNLTNVPDLIDVDREIDPRIRRILELLSITFNSLSQTGQLVRTGVADFQIVAPTYGGITGEVDP